MSTLPCPAEDDEEKDLDVAYPHDKDDDDCQGFEQHALKTFHKHQSLPSFY